MGAARNSRQRRHAGGRVAKPPPGAGRELATTHGCDAVPLQQRWATRGAGCGLCFCFCLATAVGGSKASGAATAPARVPERALWRLPLLLVCRCLFSAGDGGQRPPGRGARCRACTPPLATEDWTWATPEPREAGERNPRAYRPQADDERRDPTGEVFAGTVFRRGPGAKAPGSRVPCAVPSSIRHGCSWRAACVLAFRTTLASGRDFADGAN